jgi:hypothetical protein
VTDNNSNAGFIRKTGSHPLAGDVRGRDALLLIAWNQIFGG